MAWSDRSQYGVLHTYRHGTLREQRFNPKKPMLCAGFNGDRSLVCTAAGDKLASVFEVATRRRLFNIENPDWNRSCALTSDGLRLCTGCDDGFARIHTISLGEEQEPHKFEHAKEEDQSKSAGFAYKRRAKPPQRFKVASVAFSPDDRLLLTAALDRKARLFEVPPPKDPIGENERGQTPDDFALARKDEDYPLPIVEMVHEGLVYSARFSADGRQVITASGAPRFGGVARLWDAETGGVLGAHEVDDAAMCADLSPDAAWVCVSSMDKTARIIDAETGQELRRWAHPNFVPTLAFDTAGKLLCTACTDGYARIFDVKSEKELQSFRHPEEVTCALFGAEDLQLCTASADGAARVWGAVA